MVKLEKSPGKPPALGATMGIQHDHHGPRHTTFQLWPLPLAGRALVLGEYGGLGFPVEVLPSVTGAGVNPS